MRLSATQAVGDRYWCCEGHTATRAARDMASVDPLVAVRARVPLVRGAVPTVAAEGFAGLMLQRVWSQGGLKF
jgi:hypothetical protein